MKIGIIGAMEDELGAVISLIEGAETTQHNRWKVTNGRIGRHHITLTRCDIGKVNGAIAAQMLIDCYDAEAIINLGSSGALAAELEIGDLVIASEAIQPDVDLTAWGVPPGGVMFDAFLAEGDDKLTFRSQVCFDMDDDFILAAQTAAKQVTFEPISGYTPQIHHGRLLSSDTFVSDPEKVAKMRTTFAGLCIDMEAAAIAQACMSNDIPCLVVRTISDKADGSAAESFHTFLVAATENYGRLLAQLLKTLK